MTVTQTQRELATVACKRLYFVVTKIGFGINTINSALITSVLQHVLLRVSANVNLVQGDLSGS